MVKLANRALRKYRGLLPEEIAKREGIQIIEDKGMPVLFFDVLIYKTIFIKQGLCYYLRQWFIAHCLGHYFMHSGNQVHFYINSNDPHSHQEKQADTFAMCLATGKNYQEPY